MVCVAPKLPHERGTGRRLYRLQGPVCGARVGRATSPPIAKDVLYSTVGSYNVLYEVL